MRFEYQPNRRLPKLSWCATCYRDSDRVLVRHGSAVETMAEFFVEGAWDDDFSAGRFDTSLTFTGTGARLVGDAVLFCSPNHNLERCYTFEFADRLLVSNSLAFLMAEANERLDPGYPYYYFDYVRCYRTGLRQTDHGITTLSGARVRFHDCHELTIRRGRIVARRLRDLGLPPVSFEGYRETLVGTARRLFANGADEARRVRYRPLASISRGYDSPATAVVSAECGCQQALTFRRSNVMATREYDDDNGRVIAERIGLDCAEMERVDLCNVDADLLKLHFQNPFGSIVSSMDQVSDRLDGAIFVTGRHGEHYWSTDPQRSLPDYQEPTARKTLVQNTLEFRLDRGYIDFHLPYTLGVHAPRLLSISRSAAMAPWRVGGDYDRPIPRRIIETAGVPRGVFGTRKMGGADANPELNQFSSAAREEFMTFYHDYVPKTTQLRQHEARRGRFGFYEHGYAHGIDRWLRTTYGLRSISEYVLGFRNHQRRHSPFLYTFHWGFDWVAGRYRAALNAEVHFGPGAGHDSVDPVPRKPDDPFPSHSQDSQK